MSDPDAQRAIAEQHTRVEADILFESTQDPVVHTVVAGSSALIPFILTTPHHAPDAIQLQMNGLSILSANASGSPQTVSQTLGPIDTAKFHQDHSHAGSD